MPKIENPKSVIPGKLEGLHLFHFDAAPCAQRVRFALGEKGLSRGREERFDSITRSAIKGEEGRWVSRVVSLPRKDHLSQAYAEIHPNLVVPALVHDGILYLESIDIIEYLDHAFDSRPLIPTDPTLRAATMKRVEEAKVLHRSIRYVTFHWGLGRLGMLNPSEQRRLAELAGQGQDSEKLVSFYDAYSRRSIPESTYLEHLAKLYEAFCELNAQLADGRRFLMTDEVTIADAFWAMKILRLTECGYPVEAHHPLLYRWYQRVYQRPSFQNEVMGKNRLTHAIFRAKAGVERFFGRGLKQALDAVAA